MISFNEAITIIKSSATKSQTESVELLSCVGRVLAQDIHHDMNMPPFDKSAMDGYACKSEDLGKALDLVETIVAGKSPKHPIKSGQCSKIMTGAMIPEGADCVFMKEDSVVLDDGKVRCNNEKSKTNICKLGEDIQQGQKVMDAGTLLSVRHIPTLAGAGIANPLVYVQPRTCILATGTELVEPHQTPKASQIRNSNSSQMMCQLSQMGISANYGGIVPDTPEDTERMIVDAFEENDLVVLTGGVSVGEYDFTQHILKKLGFEILISTIATQPGKPLVYAKKGNKYAFGLAGNPVSSYIQFELYVKAFIYKWMNFDFRNETRFGTLTERVQRKKSDRLKLIPAICTPDNKIELISYHGSAHINALSEANCLLEMPLGVSTMEEGDSVKLIPFN